MTKDPGFIAVSSAERFETIVKLAEVSFIRFRRDVIILTFEEQQAGLARLLQHLPGLSLAP